MPHFIVSSPVPSIREHRLDNGLRVVIDPIPDHPLVAVNLWYHVGSRMEAAGKTGLAHLFEHLLFEGSLNVPDNGHMQHLERFGATVNGSTWYDRTNYFETLPVDALPLALWLERDRMGYFLPALSEEKLENQRDVVKNERRWRYDNRPYGLWNQRLFELAFPDPHPYHHPVIGTMEDLDQIELHDMKAFFRSYYAPNNCVLTLSGGMDPDRALKEVETYFQDIPPGKLPKQSPVSFPFIREEIRDVQKDRVELPRIYLLYHLPPYGHADVRRGELISSILANGLSSRLYSELVVKQQTVVNVLSWIFPLELSSVILFILTLKQDSDSEIIRDSFDRELNRLLLHPPSEEEYQKALMQYHRDQLSDLDNLTERADLVSLGATYFDDPEWIFGEPERYENLTGESLADWTGQYLDPRKRVCLTFLPEKNNE